MSYIVLEGRRKTRKTNVVTVHAETWNRYTSHVFLENFLRSQVQGSITLRDFVLKSGAKVTKISI